MLYEIFQIVKCQVLVLPDRLLPRGEHRLLHLQLPVTDLTPPEHPGK